MKKNLKLTGFSLLVSTLLLTSCNPFSMAFSAYEYSEEFVGANNLNINTTKIETYNKRFFDVTRSNPSAGFRTLTLDSIGEQKLLVLPISFSDYELDKLDKNNGVDAHIKLENAFFGQSEATLWESVASFYYKSSYGKLSLNGEVAPWFESKIYTVASINSAMNQGLDKQTVTSGLLREAVANFKSQFPDRVADYDQDGDGYIDAAYLVYANPYNNTDRELGAKNIFWAYATFADKSGNTGSGPFGHNYAWSSYYFLESHQTLLNRKPDAHTFIHEVSHLFGIPDYYNVNLDDKDNPLGGFDMMDYTIGDHSGLSKLLLEWAKPMILDGPGRVKLRPFVESGDLLIINNHWSGNPMDEYLLLEYYTPTALNEFDSRLNEKFKLPNRAGLKIYHVDARTVYELKDNYLRDYVYSDEYDGVSTGLLELLAHTNSTGRTNQGKKTAFKIYSLLEKSGLNTFKTGEKASEDTLFYKGDSFGVNTFTDFTFNRGDELAYTFMVNDLNRDYISVDFSQKI